MTQQDAYATSESSRHTMVPVSGAERTPDYIVDIRFLITSVWRGKWLLLVGALIGLLYGGWNLHQHEPMYDAYMVVAPTGSGGSMQMGGSNLLSVARTFGLSVPKAPTTSTFNRLEILIGSTILAERLQKKYSLMQRVFASNWDEEKAQWIKPTDEEFSRREKLNRFFNRPTWQEPNIDSLASYIIGTVIITSDQSKGVKRITVQHQDRDYALYLLKMVHREADELLREQDQEELQRRKAYIQSQLSEVTLSEGRAILIQLLTTVENRLMLLGSNIPYSGRILEPPRSSTYPHPPSVGKVLGVPIGLAFFIALVITLLIRLLRPQ